MSDLATERAHLAQAERGIAAGELRVLRQEELVAHLKMVDRDAREAEALLRNFRETLRIWRDHRDLILHAIAGLEG